jgi:hypothetical protein
MVGSRLDQVVERLCEKEIRGAPAVSRFSTERSHKPSVKHTFQVEGAVIHYIRGFTRDGSAFEAYVPEEQSGTVISYVAGLCVKPSIITTKAEATKVFGDDSTHHMSEWLLEGVNKTGYYGNTQLRLALEGRASVAVFEVGFDQTDRNPLRKILDRVIDNTTAQNQFLGAIALGEALGKTVSGMPSYRSRVTLATHSLSTREFLNFVSDPNRYVDDDDDDDYVNLDLVKSFVPHALIVNPHNDTKNAFLERTLRKWGAKISLNPEKSKFWVPAFRFLSFIDGLLERYTPFDSKNVPVPGLNPFYLGGKALQVNMDHCVDYPKAWGQGRILHGGSAGYALDAPDEFIKPLPGAPDSNRLSAKASLFIGRRPVMYVIPGDDMMASSASQQEFVGEINAWMDRDSGRHSSRHTLVLDGLRHNPFVDYGAPDSLIMKSRREYIRRMVAFTTL